jgi:TRAP-type mannitol/chloroaromatic compound transport system permease small subunit
MARAPSPPCRDEIVVQADEDLAVDIEALKQPPANLPPGARRVVVALDRFAEWTGYALMWLILALVFVVVWEAINRYAFNAPTIWAYDVSYMLYATVFMLGAAVTLRFKGHIRTDLFFSKWSPRTQAAVDLTFYLLFFFPGLVLFMWAGLDKAVHAFLINERAAASPWRPVLWPFRSVIPLCALLLVLQGLSETIKAFYTLQRGPAR